MRSLLALSGVVFLSSGASATVNPPFVPPSGAVDHVVTVADTVEGRAPWRGVRRVTHHKGWSRIDWVQEGRSRVGGYAGLGVTMVLSNPWRRPADAPPSELIVHSWPREHAEAHIERTATKTGERRVVLGETCVVWSSVPLGGAPPGGKRLSCVTEDGVELASRTVRPDGTEALSTEAVHVERRRVLPDEAQPAASLLSVASWITAEHFLPGDPALTESARVDHEVTLRATAQEPRPRAESATEIRGRFGGWAYHEVSHGSTPVALTLRNINAGFALTAISGSSAGSSIQPSRLILLVLPPPDPAAQPAPGDARREGAVPTGRIERVLGEVCEYVGLPLQTSRRVEECRTRDGIVLRTVLSNGESAGGLEAVEVRRGGTALPSIVSQSAMLDPARWGFPNR